MITFFKRWWTTRQLWKFINTGGNVHAQIFRDNYPFPTSEVLTQGSRILNGVHQNTFAFWVRDRHTWNKIRFGMMPDEYYIERKRKVIDDCIKLNWISRVNDSGIIKVG